MSSLLLGLWVTIVINACGGYADRCRSADELETAIGRLVEDPKQRSLELRNLTKFEWSRLDAFGEYSPVERVKDRTGLDYRESWWQDMHVPESRTLLVFSNDKGPLCHVEVRNSKAPGAAWSFGLSIFRETGIPVSDARFVVDREGEIPILELRDAAR